MGVVAYNIYLHPADPKPVGTATIKISGTDHFQGEAGTVSVTGSEMHVLEGRAPFTIEVPYRRADYVSVNVEASGTVEIRVECENC